MGDSCLHAADAGALTALQVTGLWMGKGGVPSLWQTAAGQTKSKVGSGHQDSRSQEVVVMGGGRKEACAFPLVWDGGSSLLCGPAGTSSRAALAPSTCSSCS